MIIEKVKWVDNEEVNNGVWNNDFVKWNIKHNVHLTNHKIYAK